MRGKRIVYLRGFARIFLDREQLPRGILGLIVLAVECIGRREVMNVVAVMAAAIERIGFHVSALIHGGVAEGFFGIGEAAGLRINVTRHVQGVRNICDQLSVSLAARPGFFGETGAFPGMDHVVMHAGMIGRVDQKLAQNGDGLHRIGAWRVIGQLKSAHQMQGEISARFHFFGILRDNRAQAFDVGVVGILRSRHAARGDGGDVQLFQIGGFARNFAQLDRFFGGGFRASTGGASHVSVGGVFKLMTRAIISSGDHGDAPPRHRRVGIERGSLQEAALGFDRPERVQLGESLIEKFLRFGTRGGDPQVDVLGSLSAHQMSRQCGSRPGGRRRTQVGGPGLTENGNGKDCAEEQLVHEVNSTPSCGRVVDRKFGCTC